MEKVAVVFTNGVPESGKDTFVDYLIKEYPQSVFKTSAIHGIEALLGIPSTDKSPLARKIKATVGDLMEEYNHFKSESIVDFIIKESNKYFRKNLRYKDLSDLDQLIIFVHVRDNAVMSRVEQKMKEQFQYSDSQFLRLLVNRPDVLKPTEEYSNDADREALHTLRTFLRFDYLTYAEGVYYSMLSGQHYVMIDNSKDLDNLQQTAQNFKAVLPKLLEGIAK